MAILNQQNQEAQEDEEADEEESLTNEATEAEEAPVKRHLPDDAVPAEEPVAQADVHLVGRADGAPTEGQDPEVQHALAAETERKVCLC